MSDTLDCGHTPTPTPEGLGTGVAYTPDRTRSMCYACADREQAEYADAHDIFSAYVSSDGRSITTWSGGQLATATQAGVSRNGFHGSRIHYWQATRNGRVFHGRNGGAGMHITLRAYTSSSLGAD